MKIQRKLFAHLPLYLIFHRPSLLFAVIIWRWRRRTGSRKRQFISYLYLIQLIDFCTFYQNFIFEIISILPYFLSLNFLSVYSFLPSFPSDQFHIMSSPSSIQISIKWEQNSGVFSKLSAPCKTRIDKRISNNNSIDVIQTLFSICRKFGKLLLFSGN